MKRTVIILQARTGSSRLPGKAIKIIDGRTILAHCIDRLQRIDENVPVIVATSIKPQDDIIAQIALHEKAMCFRGSEDDVLDRYYKAACQFGADYIIRATADNPFVDTGYGRRVLREINSDLWDYISAIEHLKDRKLPEGIGLEAFTAKTLEISWKQGREPHHREHVNEYVLENKNRFKVKFIRCDNKDSCGSLRLTVDTPDDLEFVISMAKSIGKPAQELEVSEIIEWWQCQTVKS